MFVPLQGIAAENSLLGGRFFEGLQNYMLNKNEGNENEIMLGNLNRTMNKIDKDGEKKTQRLYRCCSSYALSKLIVDNGLEDLWRGRTQIPLSSPATKDPLPRIQDRQGLCWYKNLFYVRPRSPQLQRLFCFY